jgi:hypothetical protein
MYFHKNVSYKLCTSIDDRITQSMQSAKATITLRFAEGAAFLPPQDYLI